MGFHLISIVQKSVWSKEKIGILNFIMVDIRTLLGSRSGEQAARLPTVGHSKGKREF